MIRVRLDGIVQPRHSVGLQRAVRGVLRVADGKLPDLRRTSRMASFKVDGKDEVLTMYDVAIVHATEETIVLSGFERGLTNGLREVDYAQT